MKLAILGTRGIPARYGGFETFAEQLSLHLAERGHRVTVYCRGKRQAAGGRRQAADNVRLIHLPTIRRKYFDTVVHTFLSTVHLMFHRQDAALYCNAANAVFTVLPRIAGMPVALNVDGLERHRKKWNRIAKAWYLVSEWLATFLPSAVVTDAQAISDYYFERYRKQSTFIPYGAEIEKVPATETLVRLGLEPGRYFLYVSRMEPENNALMVREAFEQLETTMKLALIGDAPYAHEYLRRVRDTRDPRVVIPGAIYGQGYHELTSHCYAYVHATEVGGTHPALIEAMGRGAVVLYLNNPENAEVAGGAGIAFDNDLTERLAEVLAMSEAKRTEWSCRAVERVRERYTWDAVADAYEKLLEGLVGVA